MNKKILLALALVGCANKSNGPGPDGAVDGDGNLITDANDAQTDASSNPNPYACTVLQNASCCVFDTSASACVSGKACHYDYEIDNSWYTQPSQGAGVCLSPGTTLALGATCSVTSTSLPPMCGQGAWCAYDANSGTTGTGTCRKLCDPIDQAAHGCPASTTCVGMLYCASPGQWPNCPSATDTHLGFCQ